ncbi:MAG: hypothetical protein B7Z37_16605 [Verrucomicrobia bacterium 12-59-8]|nr:MAG: hypothetical protein B7Z37_16605 [Verrucomicrobia bacterium 12-59-8]
MMRLARSILILAAGGAVLAPLCASGHGAEFLSAKLTLLPDAEVLLEVTADYGSNPLIMDEAAALDALADPLRLRDQETLVPLASLGTAIISQHHNWADYAPATYLPSNTEDEAHALITSAWRWRSADPAIVFEMPKGKLNDVLLWTHDATQPDAPPKWMLLLAGDRSRPISIQQTPWWRSWMAATGAGCLVLLGVYFVSRNFTLRQRTV